MIATRFFESDHKKRFEPFYLSFPLNEPYCRSSLERLGSLWCCNVWMRRHDDKYVSEDQKALIINKLSYRRMTMTFKHTAILLHKTCLKNIRQ